MNSKTASRLGELDDADWVSSLFMLPNDDSWPVEQERRYFTTANHKVGGSGLGNSRVINPPPGVTGFCDTPRGFGMDGTANTGSGVWYHEHADQTMDVIHIRPGVARFNSFTKFWLNAVNTEVMDSANYGWFRKLSAAAGEFIGFVFTAPFWIVGKVFQFARSLVFGDNANRYSYYYLAPAAVLFWKMVDNVVNDFALRCGLLGEVRFDGEFDDGSAANEGTVPDEEMAAFLQSMPGVITRGSITQQPRIDTLTIAHRFTLMNQARDSYLKNKATEILGKQFTSDDELNAAMGLWRETVKNAPAGGDDPSVLDESAVTDTIGRNLLAMNSAMVDGYDQYTAANLSKVLIDSDNPHRIEFNEDGNPTATTAAEAYPEQENTDELWPEYGEPSFLEKARNIARGGYDFFSIAVDHIESTSMSISNSVGPSGVENMINGTVAAARGAWFNASGGNVGDGVVFNTIETAVGSAKTFLNSFSSSLVGGVPSALLGGKAKIDIPDTYQDSSMEVNQNTYSFTSRATSGHPLAKLKMVFPHLVLMCAAAPISVGPRSSASPFLVEVHHQGKCHTNLGMITSLEGEFGELDGWDINSIPNQITVNFTVTNLSKNFHIPLDVEASMTYLDDSEFVSHLAMLSGTSLTDFDRSFSFNTKMRLMRAGFKLDRFFSSSGWAASMGQGTRDMFGGVLAMASEYIDRR